MAKSKKPSVANPGDDSPEPDKRTPFERAAEESEQKIVDMLKKEEFGDAVIELSRRSVTSTIFSHLAELPVAGFSQEMVRKVFGGGDYRARVRKNTGGFGPQWPFSIDHSIPSIYPNAKKPEEEKPMDRTPEIITAVTAAVKSSLPAPPPPPDNSILVKMMELMMVNRAPAVDPNVAALAEAVRSLKDDIRDLKNRSENGGGDSFSKMVSMSAKIDEMVARRMDSMGGGGGDGDAPKTDWKEKLLDIFGPVAAAMVMKGMNIDPNGTQQLTPEQQAQLQQMIQQQQPAALLPAAAQPGATATPVKPVTDMTPLFKIYLIEFRRLALQAATKGRDAFEWADAKIDDIDVKYHDKIFELANKETWFAEIFGADAAATTHYAWLLDMRNMILTRWLVADVVKSYGTNPRPEPAAYAAAFIDRSSVSFHDELFNLTHADETDNWKQAFVLHDVDAVWLEKLRAEFEKLLKDEDEETPAAAVTLPVGSQPAKPKRTAKIKS